MGQRRCFFCNMPLASVGTQSEQVQISQGVCGHCLKKHSNHDQNSLAKMLNGLDVPVLVVNQKMHCIYGNHEAQQLTQLSFADLQHELPGNLLMCCYASQPGGCGQTEHCESCTIRNCIVKTFESGQPCKDVAVVLQRDDGHGQHSCQLIVSTQMFVNTVLLRIEQDPVASECQ